MIILLQLILLLLSILLGLEEFEVNLKISIHLVTKKEIAFHKVIENKYSH